MCFISKIADELVILRENPVKQQEENK